MEKINLGLYLGTSKSLKYVLHLSITQDGRMGIGDDSTQS